MNCAIVQYALRIELHNSKSLINRAFLFEWCNCSPCRIVHQCTNQKESRIEWASLFELCIVQLAPPTGVLAPASRRRCIPAGHPENTPWPKLFLVKQLVVKQHRRKQMPKTNTSKLIETYCHSWRTDSETGRRNIQYQGYVLEKIDSYLLIQTFSVISGEPYNRILVPIWDAARDWTFYDCVESRDYVWEMDGRARREDYQEDREKREAEPAFALRKMGLGDSDLEGDNQMGESP